MTNLSTLMIEGRKKKNLTQEEIALQDSCSIRAVQYTLDVALKNF